MSWKSISSVTVIEVVRQHQREKRNQGESTAASDSGAKWNEVPKDRNSELCLCILGFTNWNS